MFNVTRQVQGSGINYEDATYHKYKMLARRIKRGTSTFGATDQTNFNYSNILCDRDDNLYVITGAGSSVTTPATHGVTVTKYGPNDHDFGTYSWSKFYGTMGHDLFIRDAAVSNFGQVAIVGERTDADDAFVMVVNSSGTLEVYDTWSPNTSSRDLYATSCWWWSDGAQTSADDLSLSVVCHNNWYAYGGSPWSSPLMLRYGFGDYRNYIYARNTNMAAQGSGYYRLFGNSQTNWNPLSRPYRNQPIPDPQAASDSGYFLTMCEYGNSPAYFYQYSLTGHYPYARNNSSRSGKSFQNIEKPGDSTFKVRQSSSIRGRVVLQDFRTAYEGSTIYVYSFYNVQTKNSSSTSDYSTYMLVKQSTSGTVSWAKTWSGYGTSSFFGNSDDGLDYTRSQNIAVTDTSRTNSSAHTWPNIAGGVYVPYRSAQNTVTVLQFDKDGDVLQAVDFSVASGTDIKGYSCGHDRKGNVFLNMKPDLSTANSMGTWRHIKVPPFGFWNVPSSQTLSVDSGTTDDDVTISQATLPTIQDQTANVSNVTVTTWSYGNPSAAYLRYRHDNNPNQNCYTSEYLCISNTDSTASPHRTSQEVSD